MNDMTTAMNSDEPTAASVAAADAEADTEQRQADVDDELDPRDRPVAGASADCSVKHINHHDTDG